MDNRGSFFFLLLVFYLLLSSQSRPPALEQDRERQHELDREKHMLKLLNESKYGDFDPSADNWLPYTGLRQNDSFAWDLFPFARSCARRQFQSALANAGLDLPSGLEDNSSLPLNLTNLSLPTYHNTTGILRGDWVRSTKTPQRQTPLNTSAIAHEHEYFTEDFSSNITGNGGSFYFNLEEKDNGEVGLVQEIRASVTIESEDFWGSTWYLSLFGVHFPQTGGIILTTSSEKFGGLFSLPHFALSADTYNLTRGHLMKSLADTISEKRNRPSSLFPWSSLIGSEQVEFPAPRCEHVVFLQQHPVMINDVVADHLTLERIERELRYPIGAPIPEPPLTVMSAVIFSPDCGYILETKGTPEYPPSDALYISGPKYEEYSKYAARLIFVVSAVFVAQITLLLRQIKDASTPSTRSRVSFYTIALMALGDGLVILFIVLKLFEAVSFLVLATVSFLSFLSVCYIGMKFMMDIWAVQEPERREERAVNPPVAAQLSTTLPPPVTAGVSDSGATPIILTPDQDPPLEELETPPPPTTNNRVPAPTPRQVRSDVGAMYARFYLLLFVIFIMSVWAFLLPRRLGSIYVRLLSSIYLSFWVPQIYRNVMRNCRKALRWDFVIGQSILRLFPFIYFLTARGNVLFIRPDWTTAFALTGWMWIQAWILASQDILGPRFFVPRGWAPHAYDYHPTFRDQAGADEDLEAGDSLSIASLRADERDVVSDCKEDGTNRKERKRVMFDCAICMQDIEVPVLPAISAVIGSSVAEGASSILSRRAYMVTPCRHIFHTACLESWMRLRLQCPICRDSIPPV